MIDSPDSFESISEIEAMIRSAGSYVQVSKDLRPRLMDSARLTNGERRVRRYVQQAALMAALLTWFVTAGVGRLHMRTDLRDVSLATASSYPISNNRIGVGAGDAAWVLVEAYAEVRGRQADVLRVNF